MRQTWPNCSAGRQLGSNDFLEVLSTLTVA